MRGFLFCIAEAKFAALTVGLTTERLCTVISYQPESRTEPLKTRRQAGQALGVSLPTIDRMLRDGDLPRRRIRGAVRIPASAIDHFILQGGR
jgi:excisionase family DNA binding protein